MLLKKYHAEKIRIMQKFNKGNIKNNEKGEK